LHALFAKALRSCAEGRACHQNSSLCKKKHLKEYDGQTKAEESRPKKLL
jgi:hypothetical protein